MVGIVVTASGRAGTLVGERGERLAFLDPGARLSGIEEVRPKGLRGRSGGREKVFRLRVEGLAEAEEISTIDPTAAVGALASALERRLEVALGVVAGDLLPRGDVPSGLRG